jgi:hypothetical protein
MGLPYVSDPAISRHLGAFLKRHMPASGAGRGSPDPAGAGRGSPDPAAAPEAILFNGGVFQPAALRERLVDVLRRWYDTPEHPWQPMTLTNPSLDLAVAWGAAHYAWLRHTGGRRIGGGIARSYYVAVSADGGATDETVEKGEVEQSAEESPQPALPSTSQGVTVVCVVPQHLEEGKEIGLEKPELELALGQPVMFPLFTSTVRGDDHAGDVLKVAQDQLLQLPPLHTVLRGGKRSGTKRVPVTLAARSTEIGTLEIWCVAREGNNRWRLEFNVRDIVRDPQDGEEGEAAARAAGKQADQQVTDVWLEDQVQEAARLIRETYAGTDGARRGSPDPAAPSPRDLTKALEAALDAPRYEWPTGLCRRLWEFLAEAAEHRRRSPAHLSRWYHLAGYCLRPGFGDALDKFRVDQLWKLMHAPPRVEAGRSVPRPVEGGADYWIMWRRVAGGLSVQLQQALANRLRPALLPGKGKATVKPGANELAEMWRATASLERLDIKQKELLGQTLLKPLRRSPVPTYAFWALTRLGARVLFYGPLNAVVHPQIVETWLDAILPFEAGHESERLAWSFCLAQLARRSGQRALDVDDSHRRSVLTALRSHSAPNHWAQMVEEVTQLEGEEQSQMFGESLPIGLRLVSSEELSP